MNPNYLAIILIGIIVFFLLFLTAAHHVLTVKADEITAHCPETGCVFLDWTHYSDFERGSKEYWNWYCSQTVDLPDSLDHYKCK